MNRERENIVGNDPHFYNKKSVVEIFLYQSRHQFKKKPMPPKYLERIHLVKVI